MNIIYMGTPEFAVGSLHTLYLAKNNILACFTQPDRPQGRSKKPVACPVKEKALELGIPVYQPEKIKDAENIEIIKKLNPDAIVVAAYGQILPEEILNIPKYGCINIHASLLPKYRGAAPIEWAVINGEEETGITMMYMDKGLDTGDMIEKIDVPIKKDETAEELRERLSFAASRLATITLQKIERGDAKRIPQNDAESSYAPRLTKEMGRLDFSKTATELERLIRGLQPWPMAYTVINGKTIKIYKAEVSEKPVNVAPGTIIEVNKKNFTIACKEGALTIKSLQPEGKKQMAAAAYLAGNKLKVGQVI